MSEKAKIFAEKLKGWDFKMVKDSEQALIFALWLEEFVNETFKDEFYAANLDSDFYPQIYTLQNLDPESEWFDDINTPERESRAEIAARAMERVVKVIEERGFKVYGDYNRLEVKHPFSRILKVFDYPSIAMNGSTYTVFNFRRSVEWGDGLWLAGSSWRMIVNFDENYCILPGGNSGNYFSKHYSDQLEKWANGNYKTMDFEVRGEKIVFGGG